MIELAQQVVANVPSDGEAIKWFGGAGLILGVVLLTSGWFKRRRK